MNTYYQMNHKKKDFYQLSSWQSLLSDSVESYEALSIIDTIDIPDIKKVIQTYPMRINRYFFDLMMQKGDSLQKQVVPDIRELNDSIGLEDPLEEEFYSPVLNLTHRYPDRVLFLISNACAVYCRFCTRKRRIGLQDRITDKIIENGLEYIKAHKEIKDVLLSGGDPLLLSDDRLEWIISSLRKISHVELIRIGTRVPGVLPQRITDDLIEILKKSHPIFMNIHFNHPDEITDEVRTACQKLADGGIPLGSQTVLLKGINDNVIILTHLMRQLLKIRVKPYYLHQGDLTKGTNHFRTPIETGIEIMKRLRGWISGMAVPYYMIDLPGGGGKVPLTPDYIESMDTPCIKIRNYQNKMFQYPLT